MRESRRATAEIERERANAQHAKRCVEWWSEDDGSIVLRARLCPEEGVRVIQAIERERERIRDERAEEGDAIEPHQRTPFETLRADALVAAVSSKPDTEIQVHVSAETLRDDSMDGCCHLEHGPALSPETARRLACDCATVKLTADSNDEPLTIGRRSRSVPPAIRRALTARDRHCQFPGCSAARYLHAHHIVHWAHGGETALDNLVLLCGHHHRLVHEGGFCVHRLSGNRLHFTMPSGDELKPDLPIPPYEPLHWPPTTHAPGWDGTRMDIAMAVDGYLSASGLL